jgi:hypothetical protein
VLVVNSLINFVVMRIARALFDFYINSSIHVAVAMLSLVCITNQILSIPIDFMMTGFSFFGTMVGYNFVKYESWLRNDKPMDHSLKAIFITSLVAFFAALFCFLHLPFLVQIYVMAFVVLLLLYAIPFFPNKKNIRNWSGVKIYLVAFCWTGISFLLPLANIGMTLSSVVLINIVQRFILILALILIFEIIDLKKDAISLGTVPQRIGVKRTKIVGLLLLVLFCFLEYSTPDFKQISFLITVKWSAVVALFTLFAHPNRSKYYTSFWVESLPLIGLLLRL